jgi:hypothetical protein
MQEISLEVAFWILDAWQRMARPLLARGAKKDENNLEPTQLLWVSSDDATVSLVMPSVKEQNEEWITRLAGAKFTFCPTVKLANSYGTGNEFWRSQLTAEFPDGKTLLIAEPVIPSECLAKLP